MHHSIYPKLPPRDIYFEYLVEQAFLRVGWPKEQIVLTTPNSPQHDMRVGDIRLSLKTETGVKTKRHSITITKLCTTETGTWDSPSLIRHSLEHLARYDAILMLRAIRKTGGLHYQLLDIPMKTLKLIESATVLPVGKRKGRQSLSGRITLPGTEAEFRLQFDGADGKCQVHNLPVDICQMLLEWDLERV